MLCSRGAKTGEMTKAAQTPPSQLRLLELVTNPNARTNPSALPSVPNRLTPRPIASRPRWRRHRIDRSRFVIRTWRQCRADDGATDDAACNSRRHAPATAGMRRTRRSDREDQGHSGSPGCPVLHSYFPLIQYQDLETTAKYETKFGANSCLRKLLFFCNNDEYRQPEELLDRVSRLVIN